MDRQLFHDLRAARNREKPTTGSMLSIDPETKQVMKFELFTPEEDWYLIYNSMSFGKETGYAKYKEIKEGKVPEDPDLKVKYELIERYLEEKKVKRQWQLVYSILILLMVASAFLLIKL